MDADIRFPPIEFQEGLFLDRCSQLEELVLRETDRMVSEHMLPGPEETDEYDFGCICLNYWRVIWRIAFDLGPEISRKLAEELARRMCAKRGYSADDFHSGVLAIQERVRLPFGYNPLQFAYLMTQRRPIRLLHPELDGAELPTVLAGIALELAEQNPGDPVLLPLDAVRALLGQRKLTVSGVSV